MVELADLDTVALVSDLDLKVLEFDLMESDSEVEQESWWGEDAIEDVVRDKISDERCFNIFWPSGYTVLLASFVAFQIFIQF